MISRASQLHPLDCRVSSLVAVQQRHVFWRGTRVARSSRPLFHGQAQLGADATGGDEGATPDDEEGWATPRDSGHVRADQL